MFGIGGTEILVILVVALMVLGPKSIPQIARTLGRAIGEFRRVSTEFQSTLNTEIKIEENEKRKEKLKAETCSKTEDVKHDYAAASSTVEDNFSGVSNSSDSHAVNKSVSLEVNNVNEKASV